MHAGFTALLTGCPMNCGVRIVLHAPQAGELQQDLQRLQPLWGDDLNRFGGPFLAGHVFSAVDVFFCAASFRVQTYGLTLSDACMTYVKILLSLSAMQDWYAGALQEPWIEPFHEDMVLTKGHLSQDFRRA